MVEYMNKTKTLVIINPRSGRIKPFEKHFDVCAALMQEGFDVSCFTTQKSTDARRAARELSGDCELIVCRGGDGTLNEVLNGIADSGRRITVGYIPSGTSNDFAKTMGIPRSAEAAVKLIADGSPHPHDTGLFNAQTYFNYTACFGVFTKASYATSQKHKNSFGYAAYLTQGVKELTSIRPVHMRVTCDGTVCEGDYIFGAVTNALCVGNFLHYDETKVDFNDGVFEVLLASMPSNPIEFLQLVYGAYRKQFDERFITTLTGRDITFESTSPVAWSLDGEYGSSTDFTHIECIKSGIDIIKP